MLDWPGNDKKMASHGNFKPGNSKKILDVVTGFLFEFCAF